MSERNEREKNVWGYKQSNVVNLLNVLEKIEIQLRDHLIF